MLSVETDKPAPTLDYASNTSRRSDLMRRREHRGAGCKQIGRVFCGVAIAAVIVAGVLIVKAAIRGRVDSWFFWESGPVFPLLILASAMAMISLVALWAGALITRTDGSVWRTVWIDTLILATTFGYWVMLCLYQGRPHFGGG